MNENEKGPLVDWVLRKFPDTPKTRAKQWIQAGRISVNGVVIRKPHELVADPKDTLELGGRHASTLDCGSSWQIHPRVSLLYLDSSLAIVDKGAGLISVPGGNASLSALSILEDFLAGRLKPQDRQIAGKPLPSAYRKLELLSVHRLDQYTTGVFCIAANPGARQKLIAQVKAHTMRREYIAFAEGRCSNKKGTWRNWLQLSHDEMRQNVLTESQARSAGENACEAITHFEVMEEFPFGDGIHFATKMRLRLETGLKHQIRIQAAFAGLPLLGDRNYNPKYRIGDGIPIIEFSRQALHAECLELEHPEQQGRRMSWHAPMPKDLRELESALRKAGRPKRGLSSENPPRRREGK